MLLEISYQMGPRNFIFMVLWGQGLKFEHKKSSLKNKKYMKIQN